MNKIFLIGNPNVGKSTIFNALTRANAHTGNWSGVTVDIKQKIVKNKGTSYLICDLPGINGLVPFTDEERVTIEAIKQNTQAIFVVVVNLKNLSRSLNLLSQMLELDLKILVVFNFCTDFSFNLKAFSEFTGLKTVKYSIKDKKFFENFFENLPDKRVTVPYINQILISDTDLDRYTNIRIQEGILPVRQNCPTPILGLEKIFSLRRTYTENLEKILKISKKQAKKRNFSSFFDKKWCVLGFFVLSMLVVFFLAFGPLGSFLGGIIDKVVQFFGDGITKLLVLSNAPQFVNDFWSFAILGGVGGVLGFLPQVAILFLSLNLLEQSGLISRIAWLFAPMLNKLGISGKSIFSLLLGFGCTTSALPTTKILKNKDEKIKTCLLLPFMSCSAKLPVLACVAYAFFAEFNVLVVFMLYLLGVFCGIAFLAILEKLYPTKRKVEVIEFSPITFPNIKITLHETMQNVWGFLRKIFTILLILTCLVWFFNNFSPSFRFITSLEEDSILKVFAQMIQPIFAPLNFSWGAVATLLVGMSAKEMVLSSIAVLNGTDLVAQSLTNSLSIVHFSTESAVAFLVFCLLYTPCVSALAQLKTLVDKKVFWGFVIFQVVYAYFVALICYDITLICTSKFSFNALWSILISFIIGFALFFALKRGVFKRKGCNECKFCKN